MDHQASTLFISIACYRDPELIPTLKDMVAHADAPQHLHIAVCWQDNEDLTVFEQAGLALQGPHQVGLYPAARYTLDGARIDIINVHYYTSRGACWARNLAEKCFENEAYFLQIDSHCRFIPGWDREMIAMLNQLTAHSSRPVISTYPPPFTPGADEENSKQHYVSRLTFREFDDRGLPMLSSLPFTTSEPVRGSYLAGGFIFTRGDFVKAVPNDPQIFFAGEEIAMAVRAFTHGYDIYHPHKPLLWHFYGRPDCAKVWDDHTPTAKEQGTIGKIWWEWDKIAKQRVRTLLGLEVTSAAALAPYTLGTQRTLREFEYQAGICLTRGTVLPEVLDETHCAYFPQPPQDETAWLQRQFTHNRKVLPVSKTECDTTTPDIESLHISVYSQNQTLLHKLIIEPPELAGLRDKAKNDTIDLTIDFKTREHIKPATIRLSPWLKDAGWGAVVEKAW